METDFSKFLDSLTLPETITKLKLLLDLYKLYISCHYRYLDHHLEIEKYKKRPPMKSDLVVS